MNKRPALGKGLSSLLPSTFKEQTVPASPASETHLEISQIQVNPNQPRREFRDQQLQELAESIRHDGIIQPLIVRKVNNMIQLVAGERRLRAAKIAGLERVPVVVQEISDDRLLEIALVENIQREDLHPIELAEAFERLSKDLGLNHEEIGKRTGKDRATISNTIRLLKLPPDLQKLVADGSLSPGHARALLKLDSSDKQRAFGLQAIAEGWTVRALEAATSGTEAEPPRPARSGVGATEQSGIDPNVKSATDELERVLGTKVRISSSKSGKGRIEIEFYDLDDLNRIYFYVTRQD